MRVTKRGVVRRINRREDGSADVFILGERDTDAVRAWAKGSLEGLSVVQEGDTVACELFVSLKSRKSDGDKFLSVSVDMIEVVQAAENPSPLAVVGS